MIRIFHCDTNKCVFQKKESIHDIKDAIGDTQNLFWLDLDTPTEAELAQIGELFQLHPLAVEDASQENQRPKIEEYDDFYLVVFQAMARDKATGKLVENELDIFVGSNYLITVHRGIVLELAETEKRWSRASDAQRSRGIGVLLYMLLDTIVDQYFPLVDALVEDIEQIEDGIFAGELHGKKVTFDILALKRELFQLRRVVAPGRDVLNILTNRDTRFIDDDIQIYFRDVYDHIARLADLLDLYREQLSSTIDANLTNASFELNRVMRTLTSTSIILMVNALIAGIYGMNFKFMPETEWQYGYFAVLGAMLVLTILLLFFFKRLKWL